MLTQQFASYLAAALLVLPLAAAASPSAGAGGEGGDCFPLCAAEEANAPPAELKVCDLPGVRTVQVLNNQMQPLKEIVGYVRSPQGLAMKLVNDHVVKIPAWVGYAMDPVGALKQRAIKEVRTRAKEALGMDAKRGCILPETGREGAPAVAPFAPELEGEAST